MRFMEDALFDPSDDLVTFMFCFASLMSTNKFNRLIDFD